MQTQSQTETIFGVVGEPTTDHTTSTITVDWPGITSASGVRPREDLDDDPPTNDVNAFFTWHYRELERARRRSFWVGVLVAGVAVLAFVVARGASL